MKITKEVKISDKDLLEGASLRFCRHFPALNFANALGGRETNSWIVARLATPDIIQEIRDRGLDISNLKTAMAECDCCHSLVIDSPLYQATIKGMEKENEDVCNNG